MSVVLRSQTTSRNVGARFALRTTQLLDDIIAFLEANGIGVRHQNLFSSRMPDKPDTLIAVYEYPGRPPIYALDKGLSPITRRPRLQIQSRARSYRLARQKAEDCYNLLSGVANQGFGSTKYMAITPLDEPGLLTRDSQTRTVLVFNCEVEFQPS